MEKTVGEGRAIVLASTLDNVANDAARNWMYAAVDVLTQGGAAMGASQRTTASNSFMVFLQFGVISSILRNYGNPDSQGNQGTNLTYPAGNMTDVDACALAAAFSFISDSFPYSGLSDADSKSAVSSLNSICVAAGLSSCAALNKDRSVCNGANATSVQAGQVATGVNGAW